MVVYIKYRYRYFALVITLFLIYVGPPFLRSLKSDCSRGFLLFLLLEPNLKRGQSFNDKRRKSDANDDVKTVRVIFSAHFIR